MSSKNDGPNKNTAISGTGTQLTTHHLLAALVGDSQSLLTLRRQVETHLGREVDGDALVQQLDDLYDRGFVVSKQTDGSRRVRITPRGVESLAGDLAWLAAQSGHRLVAADDDALPPRRTTLRGDE